LPYHELFIKEKNSYKIYIVLNSNLKRMFLEKNKKFKEDGFLKLLNI
jgi:hypothetical protein